MPFDGHLGMFLPFKLQVCVPEIPIPQLPEFLWTRKPVPRGCVASFTHSCTSPCRWWMRTMIRKLRELAPPRSAPSSARWGRSSCWAGSPSPRPSQCPSVEVGALGIDDDSVEGRSAHQGPEVDGSTFLVDSDAQVGDLVRAVVVESEGADLYARVL